MPPTPGYRSDELPTDVTSFIAKQADVVRTDGPDTQDDYDPQNQQDATRRALESEYKIPRTQMASLDGFLGQIEQHHMQWTNVALQEKAHPGGTFERVAVKAAEIMVPIAAGQAAEAALDLAGAAGGPLVSAAVGAVSGAAAAAIEYRHVGKDGHGAAEFYQRQVAGLDHDLQEKKGLGKAWARVRQLLKLGRYLSTEAGFEGKSRGDEIDTILTAQNIELGDTGVEDPEQVYAKLESFYQTNPDQYKTFVEKMMTQSVLTGFSETLSDEKRRQLVEIMTIASGIIYADSANGPQELQQLWQNAQGDIQDAVSKTRWLYILGAGTERAVKSLALGFIIKGITNGIDKWRNAQNAESQITSEMAQNDQQMNQIREEMLRLKEAESTATEATGLTREDMLEVLKPAADRWGMSAEQYVASAAERGARLDLLQELPTFLNNSDNVAMLERIAQDRGLATHDLLEGFMIRSLYDREQYSSLADWVRAVDQGGRPLRSVLQGVKWADPFTQANGTQVLGVFDEWNELARRALEGVGSGGVDNSTRIAELLKKLTGLQDKNNGLAQSLLEAASQKAAGLAKALISGASAAIATVVDLAAGSHKERVSFGKKGTLQGPASFSPISGPASFSPISGPASFSPISGRSSTSPSIVGRPSFDLTPNYNPLPIYESHLDSLDASHQQHIESLAQQLPDLNTQIGAIASIPLAAHQEQDNIRQTLEHYSRQTLPADNFALVLYANYPSGANMTNVQQTLDEIEAFKLAHPDMNIFVISEELPNNTPIGTIRALLNNALITKIAELNAQGQAYDPLIISNDGDNNGLDTRYFESFLKLASENPNTVGFLGQLDWDPEILQDYPEAYVGTRLMQFMNAYSQRSYERGETEWINSSGANFAYRASAYAQVGGHNLNAVSGEDSLLGERLQDLASNDPNRDRIQYAGSATRLYTSPRRALKALELGYAPIEQWAQMAFTQNDPYREQIPLAPDAIDYNDPDYVRELVKRIEYIINRTLIHGNGWGLTSSYEGFVRSLQFLGIEAQPISATQIKIVDASTLINNLRTQREQGGYQALKDKRIGLTPAQPLRSNIPATNDPSRDLWARPGTGVIKIRSIQEITPDIIRQSSPSFQREVQLPNGGPMITVYEDISLKDRWNGVPKILIGRDENTGQLYYVERRHQDVQSWLNNEYGCPSGYNSLEEYLSTQVDPSRQALSVPTPIVVGDETFLVAQAQGETLRSVIRNSGVLSETEVNRVFTETLEGLELLHANGIVHNDINWTNIILAPDVKLIDFEGSSYSDNNDWKIFANVARMEDPPELFEQAQTGVQKVDTNPQHDVYKAVFMLYILLSDRIPFDLQSLQRGETDPDVIQNARETWNIAKKTGSLDLSRIPLQYHSILTKGLNPDPTARYQTTSELLQDIQSI